jgi:anti-anti-sigma factor
VLPQRTPELEEIKQLVEALSRNSSHTHVVADLSRLDLVDSAFMASLVLLNRLIASSGGRLVLLGLSPHVREIFDRLRLASAFDIEEDLGDELQVGDGVG